MPEMKCRLLVIGGGPAGYVCAIRAGQLGIDTVLVEEGIPGGTCLTVGCIPSKAMIHVAEEFHRVTSLSESSFAGISTSGASFDMAQAVAWKDGVVSQLTGGVEALLRKAKVRVIRGTAMLRDGKTAVITTPEGEQTVHTQSLVLATGSSSVELRALPFGGDILSSTTALSLTELPETLAVVGGGYIGLELGMAFAKLGTRVTVVEGGPRVLLAWDETLTAPVAAALKRLGVRVLTDAMAKSYTDGKLVAVVDGQEQEIDANKVLVTVGRRPRSDSAGISGLDLAMDGAFIRIDDQCRTSMREVYAIGDVTGDPMLAHRAMAQGEMVAEIVAGHAKRWDHRAIPAVCFTDPEVVSVGLLPDQATSLGASKVSMFPFAANGKALSEDRPEGFIRIVADGDGRKILGIQAVGAHAAEFAGEFALAIEMEATLADVAATIHAHPTKGEVFHEAVLRTLGRALHL